METKNIEIQEKSSKYNNNDKILQLVGPNEKRAISGKDLIGGYIRAFGSDPGNNGDLNGESTK